MRPASPAPRPATARSASPGARPPRTAAAPITSYRVYRSTSSGTETFLTTLGNVTSWTNTGLANGTTYYYKVSALNAIGEGGLSNERSATPVGTPSAPLSPWASQSIPHGINLSWKAPTSSGGSAITGYRIYRATSPGSESLYATIGLTTIYLDLNVTKGVVYYYRVAAANLVGVGALSAEVSAIGR